MASVMLGRHLSSLKFCLRGRGYSKTAHRSIYKMNVVYFRHLPGDLQLQISLRYKNPEYGIDRDFNFSRNMDEAVSVWIARIKNNFQKEFEKKFNKKRKKKKDAVEQEGPTTEIPEISVQLLENNTAIKDRTFADVLMGKDEKSKDLSLEIINEKYEVSYNAPYVANLTLPSSILANFFVYPSKLELQFANRELSKFLWFRGKMPESKNEKMINWAQIHEGIIYKSQTDDIGHHLKLSCIPSNGETEGAIAEYMSKCEVQAGPGNCPFESRHVFTSHKLHGNKFRVISYNILADLYADSDFTRKELFPYCPAYALHVDYRKQLYLKEIIGYNSDIICLQEVDGKIFDLDLVPMLDLHNFKGTFRMKGTSGEGIATFYDQNRFESVATYGMTIGEDIPKNPIFSELWEKIKNNSKLIARITEISTSLQVTLLKSRETDNYLLVANIHLYFAPDADHIRLLQIGFSMVYVQHLYELAIREQNLEKDRISIIFCGDFNSVPQCGIYKLLTEKYVPEEFVDWWSNQEEAVKNVSLNQPFNIESACGCPKYTNFTVGFADCLDYIFYQTDNLAVEEVIPLPSEEELTAYTAIPSVVFPSDHIALVADLRWK